MQTYKSNRIITPNDMSIYGGSQKIVDIVTMLDEINCVNYNSYSQREAVAARNHLMVILTFGNAARSSNLINITLNDIESAIPEKDYDAFSISSTNYKTSLLYGEKKMLMAEDLYHQVANYILYLRPKIISDAHKLKSERSLFTSTRSDGEMSHSCISNGMSNLFNSITEFKGQKRY